jgi:hypothetical protein
MHLRRERVEPPHSHLMHAGDPTESFCLRHRDGSFSQVQLSVEGDDLRVDLHQSDTHNTHLGGL